MKRRRLLSRVITGSGVFAGIVNPVLGEGQFNGFDKNKSNEEIISMTESYGEDLLTRLVNHGYLSTTSVTSLDIGERLTPEQFINGKDGIYLSITTVENVVTDRIAVRKTTENSVIELFIHPEIDENYAIINPGENGSNPQVLDEDINTESDQDTGAGGGDDCSTENLCTDYEMNPCYGVWAEYEWTICSSDCYKGSLVGCCGDHEPDPC